ncbi:MAG: hypothetical protein QXR74_07290, partial [Candidatus Bathyarchaeia archaeon]
KHIIFAAKHAKNPSIKTQLDMWVNRVLGAPLYRFRVNEILWGAEVRQFLLHQQILWLNFSINYSIL